MDWRWRTGTAAALAGGAEIFAMISVGYVKHYECGGKGLEYVLAGP